MAFFVFSDDLRVRVQEIDDQHARLVELINELLEAMKKGEAKQALGGILTQLAEYAIFHFSTEEKHMVKHQYPSFRTHKREHADFIAKVEVFVRDFESGKLALSLDIMNFLRDWLTNHIKGTDKKLGAFLSTRGVS